MTLEIPVENNYLDSRLYKEDHNLMAPRLKSWPSNHVVSKTKMNQRKKPKSKHKGSDIKNNKQVLIISKSRNIAAWLWKQGLKKRSFVM